MINLLAKLLIKNYQDMENSEVRISYGILCGLCGIFWNLLLFGGKFLAGFLSGSIAITADAFNNLSDAASSFITLIGFRMAGQEPDQDHPFGHGRFEYIAGLLVSVLIFVVAFELFKNSVYKIFHPQKLQYSLLILVILLTSILIKGYMFFYNRQIGKKIQSAALTATAKDSLSDAVSTFMVLLSTLISHFTGFSADGYCGIFVALFITYTGYNAAKETINPLLGQAPDPGFVQDIRNSVLSRKEILGVHDIIVHNYGPGRVFVSLHAEVSADSDLFEIHNVIDEIEHELRDSYHCNAVIHMDPIRKNDAETIALREEVENDLLEIISSLPNSGNLSISVHDFRLIKNSSYSRLLFDVVVPYHFPMTDTDLKAQINEKILNNHPKMKTEVEIDKENF